MARQDGVAHRHPGSDPSRQSGIPNLRLRSCRGIVATAAAVLLAAPAPAQEQELEQIVVTGTRIARPDFESASPIVTLPQEAFRRTATSSVEQTLTQMPQFVPAVTSTTNNNSGNGGQANVSLRGFQTNAALILLDGRRLMPAGGTGAVDLNILPAALIESVEIITGGASAVYGSDAMAGVVNFRLRDQYDGVEFDGQWAITERGDGEEYSAGLAAGTPFAEGRGSVSAYVGYTDRAIIRQGDREFSRYGLEYFADATDGFGPGGKFLPFGSTFIEEGRVNVAVSTAAFNALFASYGYAPGSVPRQTIFGFNDDGTLFTLGDGKPGSVANFRGDPDNPFYTDRSYTYNYAPPNALRLPMERYSGFVRADYDFSQHAEAFAQALYADYSADQVLAPNPVWNVRIPPTNPYVPADLKRLLDARGNPAAPFVFGKRLTEFGPRIANNQYDVLQVTAGVGGEIARGWRYDGYAQYGANEKREDQSGNARRSRFEDLTFAPDGGASICGGFDPFGKGSISPECASYVTVDAGSESSTDQTLAEITVSGSLLALPAGELRTAFGVFYKRDAYEYKADAVTRTFLPDGRPDLVGFNPSDDIEASHESNTDVYVEALLPILKDRPGARSLDLGLGYRYSDYELAGGFGSYKAEFTYRPLEPIQLRGSYQRAIRAPSIEELYSPQLPGFFQVRPDPCSVSSEQRTGADKAQVEALCREQGMSQELLSSFEFSGDVEGYYGGNPDLSAVEADTFTLGMVFSSPFDHPLVSRLQVSVDWYSIEVQDAIGNVGFDAYLERCYDPKWNPAYAAGNFWCSGFTRDSVSGEMQPAEINQNIGQNEASGIDVQLDWRYALGPGELGLNWYVGYMSEWLYTDPGGESDEFIGTLGGCAGCATPEWKWLFALRYSLGSLVVEGKWRYVDPMRDVLEKDYEVPSYDYFDLNLSYDFAEGALAGLKLRAGVENLTDEDPPLLPTMVNANTDGSQYDVLGRRYFLSLNYAF